jgi:hypothetical protein
VMSPTSRRTTTCQPGRPSKTSVAAMESYYRTQVPTVTQWPQKRRAWSLRRILIRTANDAPEEGSSTPISPTGGFELYYEFLRNELAAERERRARLDQRALAILTTSAGLSALVLGLGTIVLGASAVEPTLPLAVGVVVTLAAFVGAATLAQRASGVEPYEVLSVEALKEMGKDAQRNTGEAVGWGAAAIVRRMIGSLRGMNNRKAAFLLWALRAQVLAIFVLMVIVAAMAVITV